MLLSLIGKFILTRISWGTIFFQVTGTQSMTIGFDNFGIHFTDDVNASGWVNTSTGEGVLIIMANR